MIQSPMNKSKPAEAADIAIISDIVGTPTGKAIGATMIQGKGKEKGKPSELEDELRIMRGSMNARLEAIEQTLGELEDLNLSIALPQMRKAVSDAVRASTV